MTTRNAATLLSCLEPHPGLYGEFLKYIHTGELKPQRIPLRSGYTAECLVFRKGYSSVGAYGTLADLLEDLERAETLSRKGFMKK